MRVSTCLCGGFFLAAALGAHSALVVTVDASGDTGMDTSLQLDRFGRPVVSYWDIGNQDLKLATCTSGCGTATPTWVVTTIDSAGDVGSYNSLRLNGDNPVVSYRDRTNGRLKLATCTAGCATATPTWVITVVDASSADLGLFTSLQLKDGRPIIAYRDYANGDLKLATCTAACASAAPTWVITRVDSEGDVGRYASLQLYNGDPVISYYDVTRGTLKLATCTAACESAAPTWVLTTFDSDPGGEDYRFSMQLNGANPVVSYWDIPNNALKLATCTAGCATSNPTWVFTRVDAGASFHSTGVFSSLQLQGGKPVVSYYADSNLRLAVCTANCATETPTWSIQTLDAEGDVGWYPSLQVDGDRAFVSYYAFELGDLKLAMADLDVLPGPANYQALWWGGQAQSGWGLNIAHQGDILFVTWFTYDFDGTQMWLVGPDVRRLGGGTYAGSLYRTTGPAFNSVPFDPARVAATMVGSVYLDFSDSGHGDFSYVVNGLSRTISIVRQVFSATVPACAAGGPAGATLNFQDLWYGAPAGSESGWGVNVTHQGDTLFVTWFTYDASGRGMWIVGPDMRRTSGDTFTGALYRTTGPPFSALTWNPASVGVTQVGSGTFTFSGAGAGVFAYTVNGISQSKGIVRQAFGSPATVCR